MPFEAPSSPFYPAKLLLFGEHVLLTGAPALAVPVPRFGGEWVWAEGPESAATEQKRLGEFAESPVLAAVAGLDTAAFGEDLKNGLYFKSNIPVGYGLGSSGALCAAIYDRYTTLKTADLSDLKSILAGMEGFFHGHSSGIDPLTSYLGQPILIEEKTRVSVAVTPAWTDPPLIFLVDSNLSRQTAPLVTWFLEQSRRPEFAVALETELLPAHTTMLQAWLQADAGTFWPALRQVSRFQFERFTPMIPATLRSIWAQSFEKEDYVLKICGAGGGGFLLGFARRAAALTESFAGYPVIYPF